MNGSVMFVQTTGVSMTDGLRAPMGMVSLMPAAFITASTRDVCERRSAAEVRTVSIPSNIIEIEYPPGGSAAKLYDPLSPVTVLRVPCNSGEEIVTVTPGSG